MITISVEVTKEELEAIREYADMCRESVSGLIRKIVIQEITFMKSRSAKDPKNYEYQMSIPEGVSETEEKRIIQANYNKIRKILGWDKISLGWD